GLALGPVALSPAAVWHALFGAGDPDTVAIVQTLRLPRIALGVVIGAGLGVSGAALQATLRNPLAEPYLLGVSGGAAVGAVAAVTLHMSSPALLPVAAFAGAVVAVTLVLLVARAAGARGDPRVLLMAGVVVGAFANAAVMVLLAGAPSETVRGALWWMMGSLGDATWQGARWVAVYVAFGGALLIALGREIELLALGEDPAAALGVDVERATRRVYLAASLLAAVTVAGAGLVGFVGLVVPAIVRALGARTARGVMLGAAVAGGALVVAADVVARTVRSPAELPLGAVTALIGVPFFLMRLRRMT
ncbi:MAG TPA: iron ABC transporter permease, partial [Gemmatimonadaceae bacterium]|nr:iron ABC transporter permease [Gemmatimonadaceae bacterium]